MNGIDLDKGKVKSNNHPPPFGAGIPDVSKYDHHLNDVRDLPLAKFEVLSIFIFQFLFTI